MTDQRKQEFSILITGSREYPPGRSRVYDRLDWELFAWGTLAIIVGDAWGVDSWAAEWATERGIQLEVHTAEWNRYGKRAGFIRNERMVKCHPAKVIAFWNGSSKGTAHTINLARKYDIEVDIVE